MVTSSQITIGTYAPTGLGGHFLTYYNLYIYCQGIVGGHFFTDDNRYIYS